MLPIPLKVQKKFDRHLKTKKIPVQSLGQYKKWLQYYLDFCWKYNFPSKNQESLPKFIQKLQEKKQTIKQQGQALEAITYYFQISKANI